MIIVLLMLCHVPLIILHPCKPLTAYFTRVGSHCEMILAMNIQIGRVTEGLGTLGTLELFLFMNAHVFPHIRHDHFPANLARSHLCPQMEKLHMSLEMSLTLKRLATNLTQCRFLVAICHVLAKATKNDVFVAFVQDVRCGPEANPTDQSCYFDLEAP